MIYMLPNTRFYPNWHSMMSGNLRIEMGWNSRERNRMFSEVMEDTRLLNCPSFGDQSLVEEREDPSINVILWDDEIDSDEAIIAWESAL